MHLDWGELVSIENQAEACNFRGVRYLIGSPSTEDDRTDTFDDEPWIYACPKGCESENLVGASRQRCTPGVDDSSDQISLSSTLRVSPQSLFSAPVAAYSEC